MPKAKQKPSYGSVIAKALKMADFTPAEQKCISGKIRKLMDEGKDEDQAIAIAINVCAPSKSRPKKGKRMSTVTHVAMGYEATREGGTLTIHDVPIFCACERGDFVVDEVWIARAVERARRKEREGYLPPLHTLHHGKDKEATETVRAAGVFRITRAAPITLDGKRRLAVLADLIITDPYVQDEVLRMRYPYRSIEIYEPDEEPSIDSLALLDHEAPFLEMPMLVVASVEEKGDAQTVPGFGDVAGATFCRGDLLDLRDGDGPVVACFRRGHRTRLLFREEPEMADDDKKTSEEEQELEDQDFAKHGDEEDDEEKMQDDGLDVAAVVKAIESGEISVKDMDAILAAIQNQKTQAETEEEEPAPAAVPGEAMKKDGDKSQFAKLQGEVEALRAKDAERDASDKRRAEVSAALKRLEGRPLGAELENRLLKFHKEHGSEAFGDYIDGMAGAAGILSDDEPNGGFEGSKGMPEIAMKFQAHGTEAVDRATHFCREWDTLRLNGLRTPQENYVKINMKREGFELEDKKSA